MSKENNSNSSDSSWAPLGLGLTFFVGIFQYGPVDLPRAAYNGLTGDTPVIKRQIGNYITCQEKASNPEMKDGELEGKLSKELTIPIVNGKINFQDAALDNLFDASEERGDFYNNFVWLKLDDYKNPSCGYK